MNLCLSKNRTFDIRFSSPLKLAWFFNNAKNKGLNTQGTEFQRLGDFDG